jgi:hypothetical protein
MLFTIIIYKIYWILTIKELILKIIILIVILIIIKIQVKAKLMKI